MRKPIQLGLPLAACCVLLTTGVILIPGEFRLQGKANAQQPNRSKNDEPIVPSSERETAQNESGPENHAVKVDGATALPAVAGTVAATAQAKVVTAIEVDVDGTWLPLDKAIVPTARPVIKITRQSDVPANFAVLLTRQDSRAGFGGTGKPIRVGPGGGGADLEETSPGAEVYQGSIEILIGLNTVRIQPAGGGADLQSATMLNYSMNAEDLNGSGTLDTGEDANHNGRLDPGEDLNADNMLQTEEDSNGNGVLDRGEDINNNGFLDRNEDIIPDGRFSTNEDRNVNGLIDPGEDYDRDGRIGPFSFGVSSTYLQGPADFGVIPVTNLRYSLRAILLEFVDTATDAQISAYLQAGGLAPLGVTLDNTVRGKPKIVIVDIPRGLDSLRKVKELNGLDPAGPYFFPDPAQRPVNPPLRAAALITATPKPTPAGEALPERLRNGGAAPPSGGNVGDGYNANNGGFDNDNDGGGNDFDELNIFWHHFFIQSFAGNRLTDLLTAGVGAPVRPLVAQTDSGIGGVGGGGAYIPAFDIPAGRIINPTNCNVNPCVVGPVNNIPDTVGHGNQVAHLLVGQGARVLGIGKDVNIRPIFDSTVSDPVAGGRAVATAAADANVRVILIEAQASDFDLNNDGAVTNVVVMGTNELQNAVQTLNNDEVGWRPGINAVLVANPTKIVVIPAGNWNHDTSFTLLGGAMPAIGAIPALARLFDAPPRGTRVSGNDNSLVLGISNSTLAAVLSGTEARSVFSNFGTRISVAGVGSGVPSLDPMQNFSGFGGTSGAAPTAAGLVGQLLFLDDNIGAVGPFSNFQIVEFVEATADDLGSTTAYPGAFINNDAGNGPDNHFGFGRINAWKAVLSAVNGGIAFQHGRATNILGNDSVFTTLPHINDANTQWYGFEIITSERHATVWLDGTKLEDAGATVPNAPVITAYKGVRSDLRMERGVHTATDGSANDAAAGGRPGEIVEEEPTAGIVPVGTRINNQGQYVMTFSVQRSDLYSGGNPKTLSLRRRDHDVLDRPIYNLRLETDKMRTGEVSGVSFDDFVFQIVPPDYGDAQIAPTLMAAESGARHQNSNLEWLGKINAPNLDSVTPEHNANREDTGGDSRVDVDGVENRIPIGPDAQFHDRDGRDDGVLFFPLTYKPGAQGKIEFTIGVFDRDSERYAADADHSLFVNLWIDWNNNGTWQEANNEHVLDGLQINPHAPLPWVIVAQGASGSTTTQILSGVADDPDTATFESTFTVGTIGAGLMWARMRLDYGENVGRNDPSPHFESLPSLRPAAGAPAGLTAGAARYGEVEDYLIGADFGDAPDPFTGPGKYPTLKANMGARHLDVHQEWLGPDNDLRPNATREIDANDTKADEDRRPNLVNRDDRCDGVFIPPVVPGTVIDIEVTVTSSVNARGAVFFVAGEGLAASTNTRSVSFPDDAADTLPRYSVGDPKRRLYLSGWADWNGDGVWATPGEKIIDDILDPQFFGADGSYTLGEAFTDSNSNGVYDSGETFFDQFGVDTQAFTYPVPVPDPIADEFYFRFRLAYGEDESAVDLEVKENDEDGRTNNEEKGGALFGEVEDYPALVPPDWHATWVDDPYDSVVDFSAGGLTIPSDFFGLGSDALVTAVPVRGLPPNENNGDGSVCLQRNRDPVLPTIGADDTVTLTATQLHLVSAAPVTVTYNGGLNPERWEMRVTVSPSVSPISGSLTATRTHANGGVFDATFFIQPQLTFTRLSDCATAMLDTGLEETMSPLAFQISGDFVDSVDPALNLLVDSQANWVCGVRELAGVQQVVPMTATTSELPPTVRHTVCPPQRRQVDYFARSEARVEVSTPFGDDVVTLTGPTMVHVDLFRLGDDDENDLEEVPTEMVEMNLAGVSQQFGPIELRLRRRTGSPFQRTLGIIEEISNDATGVLEIPPYTGIGAATSSFDVFFEVVVAGNILHNLDPKHMETQITHKPPADGEVYVSPVTIPLYDEADQFTGSSVNSSFHTPFPPPSNSCVTEGECCATAQVITDGLHIVSTNICSNTDGPLTYGPDGCDSPNPDEDGPWSFEKDLWFQYQSTCDGIVNINLCGNEVVDSVVAVYVNQVDPTQSPECYPPDSDLLPHGSGQCIDQVCANSPNATITRPGVIGEKYLIRLGTRKNMGTPILNGGDVSLIVFCETTCFQSAPPTHEKITIPGTGSVDNKKLRHLGIIAGDPGRQQAIRVTLAALPPPHNVHNGRQLYVGEKKCYCENSGLTACPNLNAPPGYGCLASCGTVRAAWLAPLQTDPFFYDWNGKCTLGVCVNGMKPGSTCTTDTDCRAAVNVFSRGIVPSSAAVTARYYVQVVDQTCGIPPEDDEFSPILEMTLPQWGDVLKDNATNPPGTPDNQKTIGDVVGVLNKFKNVNPCLSKARANVSPLCPDHHVKISDVTDTLDAFIGDPFPFPAAAFPFAICP